MSISPIHLLPTDSQVKEKESLFLYRKADIGQAAGLLINELRLLARAVEVFDRQGVVRYLQLVEEVSHEPDYESVMAALKEVLQRYRLA